MAICDRRFDVISRTGILYQWRIQGVLWVLQHPGVFEERKKREERKRREREERKGEKRKKEVEG